MRRVTKATDPKYIQDLYALYEKSFHVAFSRKPENSKSKFRSDLAAKISKCPPHLVPTSEPLLLLTAYPLLKTRGDIPQQWW